MTRQIKALHDRFGSLHAINPLSRITVTRAGLHRRTRRSLPGLLPRTLQLCIHCQENPAGFWVSRKDSTTARRPWCLSCCDGLDQNPYEVIPFGTRRLGPSSPGH